VAGAIGWFVFGRPERDAPTFTEYDRPGRAAATDPANDDEFPA